MHLKSIRFHPENYPQKDIYPFSLDIINETMEIAFHSNAVFFVGENGSGKSTVLKAIAKKCSIYLWRDEGRQTMHYNKFSEQLYRYMDAEWTSGRVPGSFFASEYFRYFAEYLDEWSKSDPGMINYFGGSSLIEKSHGQGFMAFFKSRYAIKGLYLLDEPENALSPKKQLELVRIISSASVSGHAQFIIATHSPILLALPGAEIYSFDHAPAKAVCFEQTDHFQVYREFFKDPEGLINRNQKIYP